MTDRNPRVRRALSPKALEEKLCRSKMEIWRLQRDDPTFPKPFRLRDGGDPVFDEEDIDAWLDRRKALENESAAQRDVAPHVRRAAEGAIAKLEAGIRSDRAGGRT